MREMTERMSISGYKSEPVSMVGQILSAQDRVPLSYLPPAPQNSC